MATALTLTFLLLTHSLVCQPDDQLGGGPSSILAASTCSSRYTCSSLTSDKSRVLPDWERLNCQCDLQCSTYGDCCLDSPGYSAIESRNSVGLWKCQDMVQYRGVYVKASCPQDFNGSSSIVNSCHSLSSPITVDDPGHEFGPEDPVARAPVTSFSTRTTYANYMCALCNGDSGEDTVLWTPRVECDELLAFNASLVASRGVNGSSDDTLEDMVMNNLVYNDHKKLWGVKLPKGLDPFYTGTGSSMASGTAEDEHEFVACRVVYEMPDSAADFVRRCYPWVDSCPSSWDNDTVSSLCADYTAVVFTSTNQQAYRNLHCAICHQEDVRSLWCQQSVTYRNIVRNFFSSNFAFLFDVNEAHGRWVGQVAESCGRNRVFDPFFKVCRDLVCGKPSMILRNGRCVDSSSPTTTTTTTTTTTITTTSSTTLKPSSTTKPKTTVLSNITEVTTDNTTTTTPTTTTTTTTSKPENTTTPVFLEDFSDCTRFSIGHEDFTVLANGSVFIDKYYKLYEPGTFIISGDTVLVCSEEGENDMGGGYYLAKFSPVLAYVGVGGLGVSLLCLALHLLSFMCVAQRRNLSAKNLASLCVALSAAFGSFVAAGFEGPTDESSPSRGCVIIAVIMYFSFLSVFFWMNAIAFDVWRTLRLATTELRVSGGRQWRRFVAYSSYAWLGPACIVSAAVAIDNSTGPFSAAYRPAFGLRVCWFSSRRGLLLFFVTPVAIILALNIALFTMSAYIILRSTNSSAAKLSGGKARRNFKLYLRLALIMGLTWVVGVVAGQVDREPIWYAFIVLNSLQGVFIFASFTCTAKVRGWVLERCCWVKSRRDGPGGRDRRGHHRRKVDGGAPYYGTDKASSTRKFGLESRDSGSSESQTSQSSRTSLTRPSVTSLDTLY